MSNTNDTSVAGGIADRINVVKYGEAAYPSMLLTIKRAPKQLYYIGDLSILNKSCVAVIGSRTTNVYGREMGKAIARKLAEHDVCVVSGMAQGIDSFAHIGALEVGGSTVAVLGCGVDICFPSQNRGLKAEIERLGLVISEYSPGTRPEKYNFPSRNRIISGLSSMTVVVQARNRSGALITAELAAEQGRELMAVPGNIDSEYNLGNNKLIKDGVTPIISVDDVLEPLGLRQMDSKQAKAKLSDTEYLIYQMLEENGELSIDEVSMRLGKPPSYVNPILSVMEMKGFIFSAIGKIFLANI